MYANQSIKAVAKMLITDPVDLEGEKYQHQPGVFDLFILDEPDREPIQYADRVLIRDLSARTQCLRAT